jgi:hypothetical protein
MLHPLTRRTFQLHIHTPLYAGSAEPPMPGMNSAPGPSRPSITTPLLASPRHRPENRRDPSTLRYNSLPSLRHLPSKRRRTPHVQFVPLLIIGPVLVFVLFIAWDVSSYGKCYFRPLCRVLGDGNETKKDVWWRNSGPYAPYRSLGPGGGRTGLPRGCEIDQVNVVGWTINVQGSALTVSYTDIQLDIQHPMEESDCYPPWTNYEIGRSTSLVIIPSLLSSIRPT